MGDLSRRGLGRLLAAGAAASVLPPAAKASARVGTLWYTDPPAYFIATDRGLWVLNGGTEWREVIEAKTFSEFPGWLHESVCVVSPVKSG